MDAAACVRADGIEPTQMRTIVVVPPDPGWTAQFESMRDTLTITIGSLAIRIEHVGSTSVPGLAAKPIIDMDVVIRRREDLPAVSSALERLGYRGRGDLGITGREAYDSAAGSVSASWPEHHLYVCAENSRELARHLAFRDFLRGNPALRDRYAALK